MDEIMMMKIMLMMMMMMLMLMIPVIMIMIFMGVQAREKVVVQASENRGVPASGRPFPIYYILGLRLATGSTTDSFLSVAFLSSPVAVV